MKHALIRESWVMNEDQFGVGLTVKNQVALRISSHGIWVLEIELNRVAGGDVGGDGVTEKHRGYSNSVANQCLVLGLFEGLDALI